MHYDLQILKRMEDFWSHSSRPLSVWKIKMWRIEGIALTWATRQVVLWSDHKTADKNGRLAVAGTTYGLATQLEGRIPHGDSDHQSHDRRSREKFRTSYVGAN